MLNFSSQEFLLACKRFQKLQQVPSKDLRGSFQRSLYQKQQLETDIEINKDLKINGTSYLNELDLNVELKQVVKYQQQFEGKQWESSASQMYQQFRLIDMEQQKAVKQSFKDYYDAKNSYNLFTQNHRFINRNSKHLPQYKLFLIVYLIFGLRTIIISKKHQQNFALNGGAYRQSWRNNHMSKTTQKYFEEAKAIYQGLQKRETSASYDFLFSLINKNIIDQPYVESLCILFNVHYKTCQPILHLYLERRIGIKASDKGAFFKLLTQNRESINTKKIDRIFKHRQIDQNNQMQKYRVLEIRDVSNQEKVQQLLQMFSHLSAYSFTIHSFSADQFHIDINPFFKKQFTHEQKSPKLKRKHHQIFDHIANAFIKHFGSLNCFYSSSKSIIYFLDINEQSIQRHNQWRRQCLSSNIVSISGKNQVVNVTLNILDHQKYSNLKIYCLDIRNIKFQGKNIQLYQKEQTYIQKIASNFLHAAQNIKEMSTIKCVPFLNIINKTRVGTSQMNIYHLRGIDKKFMIQKCCNIFMRVVQQLRIKITIPLLWVLLQLVRLSYSFIRMRKGTTQRFQKNERDLYNIIKRRFGFGIDKEQARYLKEKVDLSNLEEVWNNMKELFESYLMKNQQSQDFGLFWSYIKCFEYIMNKYTSTEVRTSGSEAPKRIILFNPTVYSLFLRMLKQCELFYCLKDQYKLQYLDIQIYYIALLYGQSIKQKIKVLNNISQEQKEQLIRPVAIIARMIQDKVNNIQKCLQQTKIIDAMTIVEKLDQQVKRIYRFNIPYTKDTFEDWFDKGLIPKYAKYSCGECQLCKHFNIFFFEGKDCFDRFPECLKLILKKINVNYTIGFEEMAHELFKYTD